MTLYELTNDYLRLLEMAQDPDVDEQALKDTMEALDGEIEAKADGYAIVLKELTSKEQLLDDEIKRLQARKKTIQNNEKNIKVNLEDAMRMTGKTKFKTERFSFGIQKNPPSVELVDDLDLSLIPDDYLTYAEPTVNKKAVLETLKAGVELGWATIKQTEGVRIR